MLTLQGRGLGLSVLAVQHIRRMRGGAQSQLMLGEDHQLYVVKFQNNPQHTRVLANEFLASRLALALGLTVPAPVVVEVPSWLVEQTPELEIDVGGRHAKCEPGLQFGSRFAGGLMPGQVTDYLPADELARLWNLTEFAGILALDKWTGNADGRQAVFARTQRERTYRAVFIDHGYCFNAGNWKFDDSPLGGVYHRNEVYEWVSGWESFEPWLTRLEFISAEEVWMHASAVPPVWYGGDLTEMMALVEKLLARRGRIRDLIWDFRCSSRAPFPRWGNA
jgi:hypothetical protein